jgi:hypothetical protein
MTAGERPVGTCKTCPWFEGGAMEGPSCLAPASPYYPWHIDFDSSCSCGEHPDRKVTP